MEKYLLSQDFLLLTMTVCIFPLNELKMCCLLWAHIPLRSSLTFPQ